MKVDLMQGDCLERMKEIPDGSVDMVLTDPPYGTTACKWDTVIDLPSMWEQLKRVTKPNGAIVMTAAQPFTSALIMSNPNWFRYCWVWEKTKPVGHLQAKKRPMSKHEDVVVFSKTSPVYNPQGVVKIEPVVTKRSNKGGIYGSSAGKSSVRKYKGYPNTVLSFSSQNGKFHPTQKPVDLMEYLIKTYTNKSDTVLDFTMGSGSTGVAAANLSRNFIGIELDSEYFAIAESRINEARAK